MILATSSPHITEKIPEAYGVAVSKIPILPTIIDVDTGEVTKSERPLVTFLGRLDPIKRPWLFVELARRFPEVEFLMLGHPHIQGEGGWEPGPLPANVRLMGHIDGAEKYRILSSAWAHVNTSIYESLAISNLEALARETPLLSCLDPGGLVSRFGIYVGRWEGSGLDGVSPLAEGLWKLIGNKELRTRLGKEGRRWVAENCNRSRFLAMFDYLCAEAGVQRL